MCVTNSLLRRKPVSVSLTSLKPATCAVSRSVASASARSPNLVQPVESNAQPKRHHKRIRKPQKPGKTAKNQERQFVVHNYRDHAFDSVTSSEDEEAVLHTSHPQETRVHFPRKLHGVLDEVALEGLAHIVSWMPHGRCFVIHKPKEFTEFIMHKYFRQSKLTSFQRQLNLYGFQRISRGKDAGGYYNEYFLRGKAALCKFITRVKVKGTRYKAASNPDQEPDFYAMPFVSPDYDPANLASQAVPIPVSAAAVPQDCYTPAPGYVSPIEDVLLSSPTNYVHADIFQPLPISGHGDHGGSSPVEGPPVLSPEIADFWADWEESGDSSLDAFEKELQADDKLTFMIEKLLED